MAKYVELPRKPREIVAVRYKGLVDGVPSFDEATPSWVVGALAQGTLALRGEELLVGEVLVEAGDWLLAEPDDVRGEAMWRLTNSGFSANWRPKRKKPVARKSRAMKVAA